MLQHGTIVDEQEQLQVFAALRCTQAGKTALNQSQPALSSADANKLNESNSSAQDGPQEFTLAPNSTVSIGFFSFFTLIFFENKFILYGKQQML